MLEKIKLSFMHDSLTLSLKNYDFLSNFLQFLLLISQTILQLYYPQNFH